MTNEMININAYERGRSAGSKNKPRQPMNDEHFVSAMQEAVEKNDQTPRILKDYYIGEWKRGWDTAKLDSVVIADIAPTKKTKKKVSKKKKAKK